MPITTILIFYKPEWASDQFYYISIPDTQETINKLADKEQGTANARGIHNRGGPLSDQMLYTPLKDMV